MVLNYLLPACLSLDNNFETEDVTSAGWGRISFRGPQSEVLLKFPLQILGSKECNEFYEDDPSLPNGIVSSQICAWDPNGRVDTW